MTPPLPRRVLVVLATAAVAVAGCAPSLGEGPLGDDTSARVSMCAPHKSGSVRAAGGHYLRNEADGPVTTESVEFERSTGVEIVGARVSLDGRADVGLARAWPTGPPEQGEDELTTRLRDAEDAVGAVIEPTEKSVPLLLGLRMERAASAERLRVVYRDERGRRYRWIGWTTLLSGDPACGDLPGRGR